MYAKIVWKKLLEQNIFLANYNTNPGIKIEWCLHIVIFTSLLKIWCSLFFLAKRKHFVVFFLRVSFSMSILAATQYRLYRSITRTFCNDSVMSILIKNCLISEWLSLKYQANVQNIYSLYSIILCFVLFLLYAS